MSEKPQHQPDVSEKNVSRETSELTPEQAMLNEILDRAMVKSQTVPKEETEQEAPTQEEAPAKEEAPPSPPEKNKPASAYIYLAVLFGAAFLMLLLAYFVQQRNNDAVLDDLRSTTASREELLEEIKSLQQQLADTQNQLEKVERELLLSEDILGRTQTSYEKTRNIVNAFDSLYTLQQLYDAGDIEGAKTFLDVLLKVEETDGMDQVETGLSGILSPGANLPLEAFPPVAQWRELKAAILEAEIKEG